MTPIEVPEEESLMPPRGVKSSKRARQYEHIKESAQKRGRSTKRAKQIAAATVNKQRRQSGETKGSRKSSRKSSGGSRKRSTSRKSSRSRKGASKKR
jgi:hypothetical protein